MSLTDALAIAQAVKKGDAILTGKVTLHRASMAVSVPWEPTKGQAREAIMNKYREWLKCGLQRRLQQMESREIESMNPQEYTRFCAKYGEYYRMLEEIEQRANKER